MFVYGIARCALALITMTESRPSPIAAGHSAGHERILVGERLHDTFNDEVIGGSTEHEGDRAHDGGSQTQF